MENPFQCNRCANDQYQWKIKITLNFSLKYINLKWNLFHQAHNSQYSQLKGKVGLNMRKADAFEELFNLYHILPFMRLIATIIVDSKICDRCTEHKKTHKNAV